ncbi:DUF3800 domain-containing protein [Corynebacterium phoceense]
MLHAFIDESEYGDKYFILSALVVSDENLESLERELETLVFMYSITTDVREGSELHGYELMQQKGDWKGIPMGIVSSIYMKALGIINKYASALYVETIDREAQRRRYTYVYNHRRIAIGYILERVNGYALRHNQEVEAYLDDHYTAPEGRKEFVQYKAMGTFGYRSSKLTAVKEMDFYDSKSKLGLQAADLCCYVYQRTLCAKDVNPRTAKLQQKMWNALEDVRAAGRTRVWP